MAVLFRPPGAWTNDGFTAHLGTERARVAIGNICYTSNTCRSNGRFRGIINFRKFPIAASQKAAAIHSLEDIRLSTFEFVTVLMSIVVGLGIARILSGFSSLLEARREVDTDWVTVFWAINVLGYHLLFWWVVVNNWRFLSEWSFSQFGALFLYGVLIFFCASLILPQRVPKGMDLRARFESIRRPFFILWLLVMCSELLDSLLKGMDYVTTELGVSYLALWTLSVLLSVGGIVFSNRRYLLTAAISFFAIYAAWTLGSFPTI